METDVEIVTYRTQNFTFHKHDSVVYHQDRFQRFLQVWTKFGISPDLRRNTLFSANVLQGL